MTTESTSCCIGRSLGTELHNMRKFTKQGPLRHRLQTGDWRRCWRLARGARFTSFRRSDCFEIEIRNFANTLCSLYYYASKVSRLGQIFPRHPRRVGKPALHFLFCDLCALCGQIPSRVLVAALPRWVLRGETAFDLKFKQPHLPRWIAKFPATTLKIPAITFQLIDSTSRKNTADRISDQTG